MKRTTFIADGKTKIFHFTFPFFLKDNVIIEVDSQPATNYNLIRIKNDLNADMPFSGGEVHFAKPPKIASAITIRRNLPLTRIVDYQPTAPYSPTAHNQDMNYTMELIRDIKDDIYDIHVKYADIMDKESTKVLIEQMNFVNQNIADFGTKYTEYMETADMSEITGDIEGLRTEINTLNTLCGELKKQIESVSSIPENADYVVESQRPTAENNYTWYRKYKSGWVEQGGEYSGGAATVQLPVTLKNANYTVHIIKNTAPSYWATTHLCVTSRAKTNFTVSKYGDNAIMKIGWVISNGVYA